MRESVYDLLNDMDHQPKEYTAENVSEKDIKKWKKAFVAKRHFPAEKWIKYAAAAAVLCAVAAGTVMGPVRHNVYAGVKAVAYDLSQALGITKELEPYKTVVGSTISGGGYSVTLNEVVLDEESMYITYTLTVPEKMETEEDEMSYHDDMTVYINGRMASLAGSGGTVKVDDYTLASDWKKELPNVNTARDIDVEIQCAVNGDEIGTFRFTASGEELALDTLTVPLDETVTLPDGTRVTFERYTSNAMGQSIYFTKTSSSYDYDFMLKGEDDLGNPVEFFVRYSEREEGRMEVEPIDNGYVSDQASSLTLTPYAAKMPEDSGKMSSDYEPVGEMFTIPISGNE